MKTIKDKLIQAIERYGEIADIQRGADRLKKEKGALKAYILSEAKRAEFIQAGSMVATIDRSMRPYFNTELFHKAGLDPESFKVSQEVVTIKVK
jgi:hypothetical protein